MPTARVMVIVVSLSWASACNGRVVADAVPADADQDGAPCNEDFALCEEHDLGVEACAAFPGKPRRWGCRQVPAGCAYLASDCFNCTEFCCGETFEPTPAEPFVVDAGGPIDVPPGCTRRAPDDWTCVLQGKGPHAFRCDLPTDDSGFARYPAGCLGNPFGDGKVCTMMHNGTCLGCAGYDRDICCD